MQLTFFLLLGNKPEMEELMNLQIFDVIVEYKILGTCLLDDKDGTTMKRLEIDYKYVEDRVSEMFRLWMGGMGKKNAVTWGGLFTCLTFANLKYLAEKVKSTYCATASDRLPLLTDKQSGMWAIIIIVITVALAIGISYCLWRSAKLGKYIIMLRHSQ